MIFLRETRIGYVCCFSHVLQTLVLSGPLRLNQFFYVFFFFFFFFFAVDCRCVFVYAKL